MDVSDELYAYIRACVSSMARGLPREDLRDLVQDAAIRALRAAGPREEKMTRPYVRSLCRHAVAHWFRARSRLPPAEELDPEAHAGPRRGDALERLRGVHPLAPQVAMMLARGERRHDIARATGLALSQVRRLALVIRAALSEWRDAGPG